MDTKLIKIQRDVFWKLKEYQVKNKIKTLSATVWKLLQNAGSKK